MAQFVIKKDGSKEPFDAGKIRRSIMAAAQRANLPEERINEVVEQVSVSAIKMAEERAEIATSEIKSKILSELDAVEPAVAESWREYEQTKG